MTINDVSKIKPGQLLEHIATGKRYRIEKDIGTHTEKDSDEVVWWISIGRHPVSKDLIWVKSTEFRLISKH